MTNMKVIAAVYEYKKATSRFADIPILSHFVREFPEPVWASFIGVIAGVNPSIRNFVKRWAAALDLNGLREIREYCSKEETHRWLTFLVQGTLEIFSHSGWTTIDMIYRENNDFCEKILKKINTTEKRIWNLLNQGRFLPEKGEGLLSFEKYLTYIQKSDPGLNSKSIALYANMDRCIFKDGTHQLQCEFFEIMRELQQNVVKQAA